MSSLHALAAILAMSNVNVELAMNGFAWNLGLVLLLNFVGREVAAAETMSGKRCLKHFVNDRRNGAKGLLAVIVASFSTRRFGIGLGRSFGERSGLSLAGPSRGRELGFDAGQPRFKTDDALVPLGTTGTFSKARALLLRIHAGRA